MTSIRTPQDLKIKEDIYNAKINRELLQSFIKYFKTLSLSSMSTHTIPLGYEGTKYLSISSRIKEYFIKYNWDVSFDRKYSCGEVYATSLIIKPINN